VKINTDLFHTLSKERYLKLIRSLPNFHEAKVQTYATLLLTLFAIIFFSIFAIGPTVSTITQLRKTLDDNKYLDNQLQTKITNLTQLQSAYLTLSPQLPLLQSALPITPETTKLIGQVRALAQANSVSLTQIQMQSIELATPQPPKSELQPLRVVIGAQGNTTNLKSFTTDLLTFERIITIQSLSLAIPTEKSAGVQRIIIQARAYYRP